jgi:hypothetical protein
MPKKAIILGLMTRVFSLLLLVPFLTVQAWALQGGPFDGFNGRSMGAFAGTYGVVMNGTQDLSDTGIMTMSIPASGMLQSRVLIFSKGLMYLGNSMGTMDQRTGSITMMSQMSHFASRVVTDGIQKQSGVFVDSMLTGKMGMKLILNYFSGMLEVSGDAMYYAYDPMLSNVALTVTTETGTNNKVQNQNVNSTVTSNTNNQNTNTSTGNGTTSTADTQNASTLLQSNAGQNSSTDNSTNVSQNTTITTTGSVANEDGSVTTSTDNSTVSKTSGTNDGTNSNSLNSNTQDSNRNQTVSQTSTKTTASSDDTLKADTSTQGASLVAGTVQTTTQTKTSTTYDPNAVRQQAVKPTDVPMTFRLDGVRQDTTVAELSPFTPPSEATFFQIEVAAPAGATGGGAGGGGGNTAVRTN